MEAIGSVVIDGAKTMFKFTFSRVKTLSKYEENILELRKKIVELRGKKMAIEEYISLARLEGRTPKPQVIEWLKNVARAEDDVTPLLEMPDKMIHQYLQCWTVAKKLELVKDLISTHFDTVALERSSPIIAVQEMAVASLVGQGAESHMKRLLEILNQDDITRIALWGMGGIGKTTLVKNLNNELRVSKTTYFDIVIWVQVSRWFDVRTIQSQIAKRIHLKVEEGDTDQHTANRILRTLKWSRKILLILDDVWEKIDLDAVGIPPRDPRCKVLLTTRSRDVCRRMVVDVSLQLNLMNEEDSWNLFVQSVGPVLSNDGIESPARKIAASFHGLPLPIKTVGNSMRDIPQVELWENAWLRWRCSSPLFKNIEKEIFGTLATSYYSLPSKILKQCFLFCSLYPASCSIDVNELIQCWVSDGLLNENQTVAETFNDGFGLTERLKDLCLLDQDVAEGIVKMHDIFRDLAIRLSRNEEPFGFHSQSSLPFYQMPNESSRRASFVCCKIKKLPLFPLCSQLTVLLLQDNPILKIPDDFFHNLKSLRVLNLSKTRITSLPSSFICLSELRALFLRDCFIETLPSLRSLGKLLILDLSKNRVKALPEGFGSLNSLKELDLSCTHFLEEIIAGSISGLSSLETLNMSCSAFNWNPKMGHAFATQRATFEELLSLDRLSSLQIRLDSVDCLAHASAWIMKLSKFNIHITPWTHSPNRYVAKRNEKRLGLRGVNLLQEDLHDLLYNTSNLDMLTCVGMTQRHWLRLSSLISLNLSNCDDVTHLISKKKSSREMFPNLQHLVLNRLKSLETIVEGIIPRGKCLQNLKTIQVSDCPMLKGVVSYAMLRHVKNLEQVKVSGCDNMSCIIDSGEHEETLPKLRVLEIHNMVSLKSICAGTSVCPVLQRIEVSCCPGLKELPLSNSNLSGMKEIRGDIKWWNGLIWDDDDVKNKFLQYFQAYPRENCSRKRKYKT